MWRLWLAYCLSASLLCQGAQSDNSALSQRAVDAERRGDFTTAISAFEQLIHNGADSPELRSNLGIAYYESGAFDPAVREFRLALAKDPNSVAANLFTGLCLLKLERPQSALSYLERAHKAQPQDPTSLLALARAEVACNALSRARTLYAEATQLDPQNAEAWYGLGVTDRALAEAATKKSIQASPQELLKDSQQSIARAMKLNPDSVQGHMLMGESFRIAERYTDAIREYADATREDPKLAAAWAGLAAAYSAAGDDAYAVKAASHALELDPNDPQTETIIAGSLLRQGDYSGAEPHARKALQEQPNLSSAHLALAKIYLSRHEPAKALPQLKAAAKDDTDASVYYLLATAYRELGKPEQAAAALQKYKTLHSAHVAIMK